MKFIGQTELACTPLVTDQHNIGRNMCKSAFIVSYWLCIYFFKLWSSAFTIYTYSTIGFIWDTCWTLHPGSKSILIAHCYHLRSDIRCWVGNSDVSLFVHRAALVRAMLTAVRETAAVVEMRSRPDVTLHRSLYLVLMRRCVSGNSSNTTVPC